MNNKDKYFIITIDTEGDNLWDSPKNITTKNALFLPRFQILSEKYGFYPTWLTNYEMAKDPFFIDFGKDVVIRKKGEIGMHIHAWNCPPKIPLTIDDMKYQPFLIEYPKDIILEKIKQQISLLEDNFQTKITSHRSGRWALNEYYAKALYENGIKVDCSVTPHITWKDTLGDPNGNGGTNYSYFNEFSYFMNNNDISIKNKYKNTIFEVPVTIRIKNYNKPINFLKDKFKGFPNKVVSHFFPTVIWMRPNGKNISDLLWLIDKVEMEKGDYLELILHSSELMPGGSPTFKTERSIERLYLHLEIIFNKLRALGYQGSTLSNYYIKKK
jgi:hypothetical protein